MLSLVKFLNNHREEYMNFPSRCLVALMLVLFFLMSGCKKPDSSPIIIEITPTPYPEPEVDRTFEDSGKTEAWRKEFAQKVEERLALPTPEKVLGYVKEFKVDSSKPDPFIGDPTVWDSTWTYPVFGATQEKKTPPNAETAKALETAGRHWDAAQEWVALGNTEAAKNCAVALAKKREWKAVALVSVLTGDLETLTNATTIMVKVNQITNTKEVVRFAFEKGKMNAARHICVTHGLEIAKVLYPEEIRSLARQGDGTLMPTLIEQGLKSFNSSYEVVADMMLYAKVFPKEARIYISRYLHMPQANEFVWVSCGEGCNTAPVRGSLELYQFVKSDPVLREIYFERIRQFINESFLLRSTG